MTPEKQVSGIILDRRDKGESSMLFGIFSAELGLVAAMRRVSKTKTSPLPDIFDVCILELAALGRGDNSDLYALKDFSCLERMSEIPKDYSCFTAAARLCNCVKKNGRYSETPEKLFSILKGALEALNAGAPHQAVAIKFLYVFCRDEGYAVKEDFRLSLDGQQKGLLSGILKTPALGCKVYDAQSCDKLLKKLEQWVAANTDVQIS